MLALPLRHSLLRVPPVSVLKWTASAFQIMGYTATALALTPLNIYLFLAGLIGWFAVGVLWILYRRCPENAKHGRVSALQV